MYAKETVRPQVKIIFGHILLRHFIFTRASIIYRLTVVVQLCLLNDKLYLAGPTLLAFS